MIHHLDSNVAIAILNGDPAAETSFKDRLPEVAISAVALSELIYGAVNSARPADNLRRLERLLVLTPVIPFDEDCSRMYGQIRVMLKAKGRPCGDMDMLIASTAMAQGAVLVTDNLRHFEEIDGLTLANWLA